MTPPRLLPPWRLSSLCASSTTTSAALHRSAVVIPLLPNQRPGLPLTALSLFPVAAALHCSCLRRRPAGAPPGTAHASRQADGPLLWLAGISTAQIQASKERDGCERVIPSFSVEVWKRVIDPQDYRPPAITSCPQLPAVVPTIRGFHSAGPAVTHATLVCESHPLRRRVCPTFHRTCVEFSHPASVRTLYAVQLVTPDSAQSNILASPSPLVLFLFVDFCFLNE